MPRRKMTQWFKDSRASKIKIEKARKNKDWAGIKSATVALHNANKTRVALTKNGRRVQILETHEDVDLVVDDGKYLMRPPLVGRHAADLQALLDREGVSCIVLCREPKTQLGFCPIVILGDTTTVRSQVGEPINPNKPTVKWFDSATDELGRTVLDKKDTFATNDRKLDYLLGHLSAVPVCDGLYFAIVEICDALLGANE
jgi:hypothetical protein